jgi:hypothetical protein
LSKNSLSKIQTNETNKEDKESPNASARAQILAQRMERTKKRTDSTCILPVAAVDPSDIGVTIGKQKKTREDPEQEKPEKTSMTKKLAEKFRKIVSAKSSPSPSQDSIDGSTTLDPERKQKDNYAEDNGVIAPSNNDLTPAVSSSLLKVSLVSFLFHLTQFMLL